MARSHIVDLAASEPASPPVDELVTAARSLWWGISIAAILMVAALLWC
jgi:hypothetical protein